MSAEKTAARPRTRRPRDARAVEIVETAARLFAVHGFRSTSVTAVAREIGMTDAGIHHHFPTKHDLLFAVLDWDTQNQADQFVDLLRPGGMEALRNVAGWGTVMESEPELLGLNITLSAESLETDARLHEYFRTRYAVIRRWLTRAFDDAVAAGDLAPGIDAEDEAAAVIALLDGLRLQWFFTDRTGSIADQVRTAIDNYLDRLPKGPIA